MSEVSENNIKLKIKATLLLHVYQLLRLGQLTSLFCATIILMGFYLDTYPKIDVFLWYLFCLFVSVIRLISAYFYFLQENPNVKFWKTIFLMGALLGGLCWGLAGSALFLYASSEQQILIILVIAGVTAGSIPLLCAEIISTIVFITASLIPVIFLLFIAKINFAYSLYAFAACGYYLFLFSLCLRLHLIIKNSISLKFENDILLADISRTKNQLEIINKQLSHAATHDPLTNLANRNFFGTCINQAIENAKRNNTVLALFYIDLDNFKEINDAYGHHVGDQLLLHITERIRKNIRQSDIVARLGGDELTILLENIPHLDLLNTMAKRLCAVLSKPVIIYHHSIVVTASIGISVFPEDGGTAEDLLKNADKAMYYIKEHGRNNFFFNSDFKKLERT